MSGPAAAPESGFYGHFGRDGVKVREGIFSAMKKALPAAAIAVLDLLARSDGEGSSAYAGIARLADYKWSFILLRVIVT
jgi:hypothetical protein